MQNGTLEQNGTAVQNGTLRPIGPAVQNGTAGYRTRCPMGHEGLVAHMYASANGVPLTAWPV